MFMLYGSICLTMESPAINTHFAICCCFCDVVLEFFVSGLLVLMVRLSLFGETKLLSGGSVFDGNFSLDLLAVIVQSFCGFFVVYCTMFNL